LGDNSDLLGGVNVEAATAAVKGLVTLAPRVEIATIGITVTGVAVGRVGTATVVAIADVIGVVLTWVRSVGSGDGIGLP
jgi:hypothetical protein